MTGFMTIANRTGFGGQSWPFFGPTIDVENIGPVSMGITGQMTGWKMSVLIDKCVNLGGVLRKPICHLFNLHP